MICFKDMTFCEFYKTCTHGDECERALTPKVIKAADKWWEGCKGYPPFCLYMSEPGCYEEIINE